FAERFFERHVFGLARQESGEPATVPPVRDVREGSARYGDRCRILSVSGPLDEVTVVAKEILGLVEERGYAFRDIGVVARTLTGYETLVPRVFGQHAIPFASTMGRALYEFP